MRDLKKYSDEEIVELIKKKEITAKELTDASICPTCFNRAHDEVLYGPIKDQLIYEDELFECFLVGNPRAAGHMVISTKNHYKDMMEVEDEVCEKIYVTAKKLMIAIRDIYCCESVYLCTMCDGPMNHFHVQLIPRYKEEERGSKNFVKPRLKYVEDKEKILKLRKKFEN